MSEKETREKRIISESEVPPAVRRKIQQKIRDSQNEWKNVAASGNVDEAIEMLTEVILADMNTLDKRQGLRNLYARKCQDGDPIEYGYLKVIEAGIAGAKDDYILYLKDKCQPYKNANTLDDDAISYVNKIAEYLLESGQDEESAEWYSLIITNYTKKKEYERAYSFWLFKNKNVVLTNVIIDIFKNEAQSYKDRNNTEDIALNLMKRLSDIYRKTEDDLAAVHWLICGQFYDEAFKVAESSKYSRLINLTLEEFESEYRKYKDTGNTRNPNYSKVTFNLAKLKEKDCKFFEAISLYIECENFERAYNIVDLKNSEAVRFALEKFRGHEESYADILDTILKKEKNFRDMFTIEPPPSGMPFKYLIFSVFYAAYRLTSITGSIITGLILIAIPFALQAIFNVPDEFFKGLFFLEAAIVAGIDSFKSKKWADLHELYVKLSKRGHWQLWELGEKTPQFRADVKGEKSTFFNLLAVSLVLIGIFGYIITHPEIVKFKETTEPKIQTVTEQPAMPEPVVEQSSLPIEQKEIPDIPETNSEQYKENFSEDEARQAFINYHQNITDKNYSVAYEALTSEQKQRVGDFNHYVAGYSDTISSTVDDMSMISSEGNTITFSYNLTAQDNFQGNRIKIQKFAGQVTLVKVDNKWLILNAKSTKVDEYLSPTENEDTRRQEKNISSALNAQDLSLGNLTIHDREDKVQSILGNPISSSNDNGSKRLKFKDIEVVLRQGKVSALVSLSSAVTTPRGIHEGSSAQEVFDKYGTNYEKSSYGDEILYEYVIQSSEGQSCYLRFAVNDSNGKVAYISVRFVQ